MSDVRCDSVELGNVVCPSGTVVLLDGGLLDHWTHDRDPALPDFLIRRYGLSEERVDVVDLEIVGRDAERAGMNWNMMSYPMHHYDVPKVAMSSLYQRFESFVGEMNLDARFKPLADRVNHRKRVELLKEFDIGAGVVRFHGLQIVCCFGVPNSDLPVIGRVAREGPSAGQAYDVSLILREGATIADSIPIGQVSVDWARLTFIDCDAMGEWEHHASMDGLSGVAYWGLNADEVRAQFGGDELPHGVFGWENLPVEEAEERYIALSELRDSSDLRFACDYRPHSHHWQAMEQVRASSDAQGIGSGVVEVGDARVCFFESTFGDGHFDVYLDYDADDQAVALRVDFSYMHQAEASSNE